MGKVIGIDLGTTYSAAACLNEDGKPVIIPDRNGNKMVPSIVAFTPETVLVGFAAGGRELSSPQSVVKRIKRKMGTDYKFSSGGRDYSPEEISSFILKHLKSMAEEYLGCQVREAIITVPAYFNDNQRQATKTAGKLAGLNVRRIINEPTAASLSYGIKPGEDLNIMVYDLGGGTFDVSILSVSDGIYEVVSTAGDNNLGGEDFNMRIIDIICDNFKKENGIDLREDPLALVKIASAVEKAKRELSTSKKTSINVPFITADENGPKNIDFEITRKEFEDLIEDYLDRTMELCGQAAMDAGISFENIDRIIPVGGSSRIPAVRQRLSGLSGKALSDKLDPEQVVACGAAIQGGIVEGDVGGIVLVDVTPLSLGIEVEDGFFVPIIERNNPIPTAAKRTFTTVADSQKIVDIHIMQGESMYSRNNISLGKFRLEGIRQALRGEPRIEVNFELDVNGILQVSAQDIDTKNIQQVTIVNENRMSEQEFSKLREEYSEKFDHEIKKRDILDSVLIMQTKAETMISRLYRALPPVYEKSLIREEIEEIRRNLEESVRELDRGKLERLVQRLDFLLEESAAGVFNYGEIGA
ncbi:MAG: Hsp70 family protein [Brevinematales bacterium]|jgi:molecular chaperone DnaK